MPPAIGIHDLAVGGAGAALALVQRPDPAEQRDLALAAVGAVLSATARPLEWRRVRMGARTAALQALVLSLKSFRALVDAGEATLDGADGAWLLAAEQSLEATLRGDPLMATHLGGTFPRWVELSTATPDEIAVLADTSVWRRRAEAVALAELQLALAPEPVPAKLATHLTEGSSSGCPGWLAGFGLYLAWQMRSKPELACAYLGCVPEELDQPRSLASLALEEISRGAQRVARDFEPYLPEMRRATEAARSGSVVSIRPGANLAAAGRTIAVALKLPEKALLELARQLGRCRLPQAMLGRLMLEEGSRLVEVTASLAGAERPEWKEAAHHLAAGRVDDALAVATATSMEGAAVEERILLADLHHACGRRLAAVDGYSRAFEVTADNRALRVALQLRMAVSLGTEALVGGDGQHHRLAANCAERALADAKADGEVAIASKAAVWLGRLAAAEGAAAARGRAVAAEALGSLGAIGDQKAAPAERLEALAMEVELLLALASGEAKDRERRLEVAEAAARRWLEPVPSPGLPEGAAAIAQGLLGRVLLARAADGDARPRLIEAAGLLESALASPAAAADPFLAGSVGASLAEAHLQLAKPGDNIRAQQEAAAIAYARALQHATEPDELARRATGLQEALSLLGQGSLAERRLRQALAAFDIAESVAAAGAASETRATAYVLRSTLRLRLGKETGLAADLEGAVRDAELGIAMLRAISPKLSAPPLRARVVAALKAKATALLEQARGGNDLELLDRCDAAFMEFFAQPEASRMPVRERCELAMARAEILDTLAEREPVAVAAREARARAVAVYEEVARLAKASNLDEPRRNAEAALARLNAVDDDWREAAASAGP